MTVPGEYTQTTLERTEEELSWAGLAVAGTLRTAELAVIAVIALLVCPPLAILTVVVVVPLIALALVIGAIAAVIALPVFVVRHLHRHRATHAHTLVHRLAQLGRQDSAVAASRVRGLAARAQAKLYVKRGDRTVSPPNWRRARSAGREDARVLVLRLTPPDGGGRAGCHRRAAARGPPTHRSARPR
jgi:hypothetical protein